jgi:TolB-like protein
LIQKRISFIDELRRRKIIRVAIVYLVVTFALLQFADIALPRLNVPDWTITLVLVLSLMGLPIVLVGAWAFDVNPDRQEDETEKAAAPPTDGSGKLSLLHGTELLLIFILVGAVGYLYFNIQSTPGAQEQVGLEPVIEELSPETTTPQGPPSIAVLPFVNMSDDPANEYFSDGISEELLDALAKLRSLKVVARTSSFSFKGKNYDVRKIGEDLNVSTVLEGSVRKSGNSVRITAQLINTRDGYHLWSETYDRELDDIFAVQDDIAQAIVEALHIPLGLEKSTQLVTIGTDDIEAYNEYLRGLHFSKLIGEDSFNQAIKHLNMAVTLDPKFAEPYGLLASVHSISALWTPAEIAMPQSVRAFERALQLEPSQGLALITKAQYITLSQWDWPEAKRYFIRGLKDESVKSLASFSYAVTHLMPLGLFEDARTVLAEAEANDPVDPRLKIASSTLSLLQGDFSGAIDGYGFVLRIDPENIQAASAMCTAYVQAGKLSEAKALMIGWEVDLKYFHPWLLSCRALLELSRGEVASATATYRELTAAAANQSGLAFIAGDTALALGNIDEALNWYEKSVAGAEPGAMMIRARLQGQEILAHPRMQNLLRSMRLDDASLQEMGILEQPSQGSPESLASSAAATD